MRAENLALWPRRDWRSREEVRRHQRQNLGTPAAPPTPAAVCRDFSAQLLASSGNTMDQSRRLEFFSKSTKIQSQIQNLDFTTHATDPATTDDLPKPTDRTTTSSNILEFYPLVPPPAPPRRCPPKRADIIPAQPRTYSERSGIFFSRKTTGASSAKQKPCLSPPNYLIERTSITIPPENNNANPFELLAFFPRRAFFCNVISSHGFQSSIKFRVRCRRTGRSRSEG